MKVRIDHPVFVRLNLQAGDVLDVRDARELDQLLTSVRVDGVHVAHVLEGREEDEYATVAADGEVAVVDRGRKGRRHA